MNFYKVVYKDNGKYLSAIVDDTRNAMVPSVVAVQYRIGKWSKPTIPNSKLFCYKSKRMAKEFVKTCESLGPRSGSFKVFECKVKKPKVTKALVSGMVAPGHMFFYWNASVDKFQRNGPPTGYFRGSIGVHVRADEIKLIKEV
jgi:hypothetical protein